MLRSVLIAPSWPPEAAQNGVVSYVARLAQPLRDEGVDVRLVAGRVEPGHEARAAADGVACAMDQKNTALHWLGNKIVRRRDPYAADARHSAWRLERTLTKLHRDRPIDLYEMEEVYGLGDLLVDHAPGRQVVRLHGPWFLCVPALGLSDDAPENQRRVAAEGRSIRRAHAVSSPSAHALDAVRERYGLLLPRARVIPNATPLAPPDQRWERGRVEHGSILFVGRFDRLKGADTVIEAFGRVHRERPEATLVFAGPDRGMPDGEGGTVNLDAYLRRTLSATALEKVRCLGPVPADRIAALRTTAEVTVIASRFETFGMTVIEAMAAGGPLLGSRAGAIPEVLSWAGDEVLFEPGDDDELATKILALFASTDRADELAAQGRAACEERFSPHVVAQQTAAFYRDVAAG